MLPVLYAVQYESWISYQSKVRRGKKKFGARPPRDDGDDTHRKNNNNKKEEEKEKNLWTHRRTDAHIKKLRMFLALRERSEGGERKILKERTTSDTGKRQEWEYS